MKTLHTALIFPFIILGFIGSAIHHGWLTGGVLYWKAANWVRK